MIKPKLFISLKIHEVEAIAIKDNEIQWLASELAHNYQNFKPLHINKL